MDATELGASRIGWRATAGSVDEKNLISEFQVALLDEIGELKGKNSGRKTEVYDGQRVFSSKTLNVYRFLSDDADEWCNRKPQTELSVNVNGTDVFGRLDSADKKGINIALEVDMGDSIEEAILQDSSFFLLEKLNNKLATIKSGEFAININGSMKLFGFDQPDFFDPIPLNEQKLGIFSPNCEQEIAIRKALSQEITFIWGPPGTGKTKTLAFIVGLLIAAGKKVLLTANTNAAVDEILRKFINDKENASFVQEGKIIRVGIPTFEDEEIKLIVPKLMIEKRNEQTQITIADIQKEIDLSNQKIASYEEQEQNIIENDPHIQELNNELRRTQSNTEIVTRKHETARDKQEHFRKMLSTSEQKLETGKHTTFIKRIFSGANKEQIEHDIKTYENQYRIAQLELSSLQKNLDELMQTRNRIADQIKAATMINPESGEILTLDLIQKKKTEILAKNRNHEEEITKLQQNIQDTQKNIIKDVLVIATTIARACIDPTIMKEKFDVLIIDEASMAPLPNIFYLAGLCSTHYVISGDFRQLSPIAQGKTPAVQTWLKRDIFSQAGILERVDSNRDDERLVMLREQYRMHPSICSLISEVVYDGKLKTPDNVADSKELLAKLPPFEGRALIFCDTATADPFIARPKNSYSRISPYSAVVSVNLALKCVHEAAKKGLKTQVGIVTPYSAQAKLINRILYDKDSDPAQVKASTIHRFQGAERDCIIFDLVEGKPLNPGRLTQGPFRRSEPGRLINVAISRAMGKFILVGNSDYITKNFWADDAVPQLLEQIEQKGEIVDSSIADYWSHEENGCSENTKEVRDTAFTIYDQTNFYQAFLEDMKRAKSRIVIFSPFISRKRVETLLSDFHSISQRGVPIYIITRKTSKNDVVEDLVTNDVKVIFASKEIGFEEFDKFHFKLALVDNSVVYYGSLNILAQFESAESMIAFRTKKTVSQLIRSFGIDHIIKSYAGSNMEKDKTSILQSQRAINASEEMNLGKKHIVSEETAIAIQKSNLSNPVLLAKAFGKVRSGKEARQEAEERIARMGRDLGFRVHTWYEIPNLLNDGIPRYISVVWMNENDIEVAFQVRKKRDLNTIGSFMDQRKLHGIRSKEKYIVNISQTTGLPRFFRMNDSELKAADILSQQKYEQERKTYERAYEFWSKTEDEELSAQFQSNLTTREIARIHKRQRGAIRARLIRLGLIQRGQRRP